MKKILICLLATVILFCGMVSSVSAASEATPRYNQAVGYCCGFAIFDGVADVYVDYSANSSTFTRVTIKANIQRKLWNLFWVNYDIGIDDSTWIVSSTKAIDTIYRSFNIADTGNYRCNFTLIFEGSTGNDTIEETITCSYT